MFKVIKLTKYVLFIVAIFSTITSAQEQPVQVRYLTTELIYLSAGRNHGIQTGDSVHVFRNDQKIASLSVVAVAENSASCRILKTSTALKIGDLIHLTAIKRSTPTPKHVVQERKEPVSPLPPIQIARKTRRISGSFAGQYYQYDDSSPANYDFRQPTIRLNLKISDIGSSHWQLNVRSRVRFDQRRRSYGSRIPQNDWNNRIYQCYMDYNNPNALFNAKFGRIIDNGLSGAGYIDGMMGSVRISDQVRIGALAGTQPEWQYADFQTTTRKVGSFITFSKGIDTQQNVISNWAVIGEYHGSDINREFVTMHNEARWDRSLWLYQSAEMEINRGWRKEKSGQSFRLSNLYINAQYDAARWLSLGLSFDSRQNYWTFDVRSLSSTLFDVTMNRSARAQLNIRLPGHQYINASYGLNKKEDGTQPTRSFTLSYNNNDLLRSQTMVNAYVSGYSSPFYSGVISTFSMSRNIGQPLSLNVRYTHSANQILRSQLRINHQMQIASYLNLGRHPFLNVIYEYNHGDDEKGYRTWAEMGYRF
jgi:hypothetical protein